MVELEGNEYRIRIIRTVDESYNIALDSGMLPMIARDLKKNCLRPGYPIITDSNVRRLYAHKLARALEIEGLESKIFSFPAGEESKSRATKEYLEDELLASGFGRDTVILALGGGVVGDMAGYVAATYLRGVQYIQIPTTLLAQADASVGGKTAVNTEQGKNLVGAFKQPLKVYIDIDTLKTLDSVQWESGLAETVKHAVIKDRDFFNWLESHVDNVRDRNYFIFKHLARTNFVIKANVVQDDPEEKGLRKILNYGHTVGHAVEKLLDYSLPHGHCVSIGMMVAARISDMMRKNYEAGFFPEDVRRQEKLLSDLGLPVKIPKGMRSKSITDATMLDKKEKDGRAMYCLPKSIGEMNDFGGDYTTYVPDDVVLEAIRLTRP